MRGRTTPDNRLMPAAMSMAMVLPTSSSAQPDGSYATVVFGATSFAQSSTLTSLDDGTSGFRLSGSAGYDAGHSVIIAGDINGDGFDDMIVGARYADPNSPTNYNSGSSFVVFGASSFASSVTLTSLNGANGFRLDGIAANDFSGDKVAGGGDFNGDGFDDLVVGARFTDINGVNTVAAPMSCLAKRADSTRPMHSTVRSSTAPTDSSSTDSSAAIS